MSPSLYSNLGYNAIRDLAPVARFASVENVMVVNPSFPAKTLKEFIALARAKPGKINYGSGGAGTTNHLANELLKYLQKIDIVHVPYKGATFAAIAVVGGEVDQAIVSVASILPLIQEGKLRALAVLSEKRLPTLPDVPTAKEAGVDDFEMAMWFGMVAPIKTPREIIARLNQEASKALKISGPAQAHGQSGHRSWFGTPEQFGDLIRKETATMPPSPRAPD